MSGCLTLQYLCRDGSIAGGTLMPVHDWTRVKAGIFHDFHMAWIFLIKEALNAGLLPPDYYALTEQHAGGIEPDVLTLKGLAGPRGEPDRPAGDGDPASGGLKVAPPRVR